MTLVLDDLIYGAYSELKTLCNLAYSEKFNYKLFFLRIIYASMASILSESYLQIKISLAINSYLSDIFTIMLEIIVKKCRLYQLVQSLRLYIYG